MQDWLSERAQATPDKTALVCAGEPLTYSELALKSGQYRLALENIITQGQHIALLGSSNSETAAIIFALIRLGAVIVPINTRLTPDEIEYQVTQADCDILLYDHSQCNIIKKLQSDKYACVPYPHDTAEIVRVRHALPLQKTSDLDAPFAIIHTSGTSGKPKGAVLTYGNIFYSAMASAYRIGHNPDDNWLCCLPLYHVGGLSILIRACLYGIAVDLRPKFDVSAINHALSHENITLISLVPTMLYRLLDARTKPWSDKLRLVLLGGAATSPELMQQCIEQNIPVATTYGLSEAASQVATALPGDAVNKPGSVGKPLLFTHVRIIDENGDDLASGGVGEVIVNGPTVMQGYYNHPESTAKTLRDGWLHTGDMGHLDDEGDLFIVQRRSDLIVSGGENVYPAEVENILKQHSKIKSACVVGIENPEWGQIVGAAIVLQPGQTVETEEIIQHCRQHLAGYKQPRQIKIVPKLPLTASGKIHRPSVQALLRGNE